MTARASGPVVNIVSAGPAANGAVRGVKAPRPPWASPAHPVPCGSAERALPAGTSRNGLFWKL